MFKDTQSYRESLSEVGKFWYDAAVRHMETHYPEFPLVMSYQRPTYKLIGKIFLMLGGGKEHFSIYTTDFEYVESLKLQKIKGLKFGKSAVLFQFKDQDHMKLATTMMDEVIERVRSGVVK
jgi:uncharacterized protein YdhG (YjbR/CyaY superfamily)